ncbi:glycine betaine/proline transport system permease protein/glycine betaine/proline transport system substrate-binding protein [Salinibacillus kushneri]|uniref:Glycine betaine/proline transport system permease protein/glycine betaine/proline transport system substrate-binding protein n=1 Tax=Salinibacillus kushneri TaxID=237682 RepID=A0A1I0AXG2_9BACI|nr:ABC transporter permease subunit [Salinibacillus kushneri]SES99183.1 glycine betaine/proline transport system permease protein/glycine betaine/proline transport system substrate-binding protein [Salinibacillus kushneri]
MLDNIPTLPVAEIVDTITDWIEETFSFIFDPIKDDFGPFLDDLSGDYLAAIPPWIVILIVAVLAFFVSGKKFGLAIFSIIGLWFIQNQGQWEQLMYTFVLVIAASIIAIIIGVPIGILMSKSKTLQSILTPILDFMQTMPAFVYLIPTVAFFSIGMPPGVFAALIFATPPTIRLTNLGIRQVPNELIEASEAFGSTPMQKLIKVELPMAKKTIMAGINQTVMLTLSMVVIASMIGAPGLGREVMRALQRADVGSGFVAGIGIVILAIIIDRFTQYLNKQKGE